MATGQTIVTAAYEQLGMLEFGRSPSTSQSDRAMLFLSRIIDSLNARRPLLYTTASTDKTLTAGDATYTLGTGGDVALVRPTHLTAATIRIGNVDRSLDLVAAERFASFSDKVTTSAPRYLWNDEAVGASANQLATLHFYPTPDLAYVATLYYNLPIAAGTFTALANTFYAPQGYERLVIMMLAKEMASTIPMPWTNELQEKYDDAMGSTRDNVTMDFTMYPDVLPMGRARGRYNIATDRY